jgi:hypothetical protein
MTLAVSSRKRASPGKIVDVPLTTVPDKVEGLQVAMSARDVLLQWEPAGGLLGFLLDRALPIERPPVDDRPAPSPGASSPQGAAGPTLYNVYREIAPDPLVLPSAASPSRWNAVPATPVNPQPLTTLNFKDADVAFDERRRCYHVRAVRGAGAQRVEGEPSKPECVVPVDTEPPAVVTGLSVTVMEGSIVLRWEPNGEEDLQGYIVSRADEAGDTLVPLVAVPLTDTRYIDATVMPGRMYIYVVQAVDNRIPVPNASEPTRITATAR